MERQLYSLKQPLLAGVVLLRNPLGYIREQCGCFVNCKEYARIYTYASIEFNNKLMKSNILKEWIATGLKYHVLKT